MAGLHFDITADNKNFIKALNEITASVHGATSQIEKDGVQIEEFFNRIRNISAISFAGFGLGEMVSKISTTRAYFQDIESSMKVFLGDAEKAAAFTEELQHAAYYNMYDFAQLADASKQLIAYGNDVEDVTDIIYKLSEVGQATGQQLGDIVSLYNKAKSTGVVDSNAIDSWASKGLILKDVMKDMGTYVQGQTITFKQLNEVLDKVTSEGGMFYGIQDSMMENINSNIGQLEDQLSLMFNDIGKEIEQPVNWALKKTSEMMDHWKEIGFIIAAVIASVGTQKGIELVTNTIDKTATQAMYAAEQSQLQALLPIKEQEEQTSLQQAVAAGHLSEAKAAEIEELHREVEAYLESLAIKEKAAIAEKELADIDVNDLTEWKDELDEKIEKVKEYMDSLAENAECLEDLADMSEYESALEELNTLERERNSVATELNTATERQNTAARNLATVSTERETVAQTLDTTAKTNNTFATRLLTAAHTALLKSYDKLKASMAANPYAVAIAGAALLGYGIYKLATYQTNLEKCIQSAEEASNSQLRTMNEELSKLDKLKERLSKAKKGTEEWKEAKKDIVDQFGGYLNNLDDELEKTKDLAASYDKLTRAIRTSAAARAMDKYDKDNDISEDFDKNLAEIQKKLEGKFHKIDKDGKIVRNSIGLPIRTTLSKEYKDGILKAVYDYMNGENVKFTTQTKEYLNQLGFFDRVARSDSYRINVSGLGEGIRKRNEDIQKGRELIAERYQTTLEEIDKVVSPDREYADIRTEKEQLKSELDALIKQYDNLRKSDQKESQQAKELLIKIKEKEKELKDYYDYKSENKKKSGPTSAQLLAKEENAALKLADVMRRQAQERLRMEQDYEHERWQTRIDLMEEGEAKVLAQQKLDFEKGRLALQRRKEQEIEAELQRQMAVFEARENVRAAANKKYARKTFDRDDMDFTEAISQLLEVEREIESLNESKASIEVKVDVDSSELDESAKRMAELERKRNSLTLSLDIPEESKEELQRIEEEIASIEDRSVTLSLKSQSDISELVEAEDRLLTLKKERFSVSFDIEKADSGILDEMKEIESEFSVLMDKRAELTVAGNTDTKAIEELDSMLDRLEARRRAIAISVGIPEESLSRLQEIDREIASLDGRMAEISIEANADMAEIEKAKGLLESLKGRRESLYIEAESNAPETIRELKVLEDEIDYLRASRASIAVNTASDTAALNEMEEKLARLEKRHAELSVSFGDVDQQELRYIAERFDELNADLTATQNKAEQDRFDAAREAMNAYLKEFGNYQQKRLAIEEEYERKISEAQNEGERMSLIGQRNKTLSDLDYDEWIETGEVALAFGEVQDLSGKTITRLITDMEKYREKVIATFDPDKIRKYEDALANLHKLEADNSLGAFAGYVPDWFRQRQSVGSQMESAGSNLNSLESQMAKLRMEAEALTRSIALSKDMGADTSDMESRLNEVTVLLAENENAVKKARNAFRQLQEQWESLNTPEAKFYALCGAVSSVTGLVGDFASQAAELADAMGAEGLASALGTFADAMGSVGNIANGFAQGGIIGGIAAGVGEVMKWTTKLFQAGDNRKQKNIERIQEQIDALGKSYDRLSRLAEEAFSTDASQLIEQQDTLLRQQQALIRQQIVEEEAKKKTDSEKIKQWKEQLEEINETLEDNSRKAKEAIIGEDLKSAINEFASLYAEAWNDGTDAAQKSMAAVKNIISSALSELLKKNIQPAATRFYDALAEAMKDGVLTDVELDNLDYIKRQMDVLAAKSQAQWEMIQNRYRDLDELKEELTDISFDSVCDDFKSKLADMSSTTKDFANDFTDTLRNALLEGLMNEKYDLMLREWYDEFAEAMNDRNLTDSERDSLRQQYDAIVQQGLADRDFINDIVGGGAYSQEASKGWSTTLTQDQGDELNGRFTALTELEAINNNLVAEGNLLSAQILETLRSMTGLSMVSDGDNSTLREIRDMMFLSTGHLEDIAKYSKLLSFIREGIDKMNDLINTRL